MTGGGYMDRSDLEYMLAKEQRLLTDNERLMKECDFAQARVRELEEAVREVQRCARTVCSTCHQVMLSVLETGHGQAVAQGAVQPKDGEGQE